MSERIVFLLNLLQDVNVLRPLVFLARRETPYDILFLVSKGFRARDTEGLWNREIEELAQDVNARKIDYATPAEALEALQGGSGKIIAGSESDLGAHAETHGIFRLAPPGYLRITLQHGLECVGFRQSAEHDRNHGQNVGFAADVLCTWLGRDRLTAMKSSERSKVLVTGPSALLQKPLRPALDPLPVGGLICENLHSVRLQTSGPHHQSFMNTFNAFCAAEEAGGRMVTLRPHPGGQYVLRNKVHLPGNVVLNNLPIYRIDLAGYSYGLSAPSTMILDMVMAGLPTAVWCDEAGSMDTRAYDGLTPVSTWQEWLDFAHAAARDPAPIRARQATWLSSAGIQLDRNHAFRTFARLRTDTSVTTFTPVTSQAQPRKRKVLIFANGEIPTLEIWFTEPLRQEVAAGKMVVSVATETEMTRQIKKGKSASPADWIRARFTEAQPDVVVSCRYSGPAAETILELASEHGCPFIYHIDDDLLDLPPEIGEKKYAFHMDPKRLGSVRRQLRKANLVYCSTDAIAQRVEEHGFRGLKQVGDISCYGAVLRAPKIEPVVTIGYMGFDHASDFALVAPQVFRVLEENENTRFEIFGAFALPESFLVFGQRVLRREPVRGYDQFMRSFSQLGWDIGIAPLVGNRFNKQKSLNKWAEYTAIGAATIASSGTAYDQLGERGVAMLVADDGWYDALTRLTRQPEDRVALTASAQKVLKREFSIDDMRRQTLRALEVALQIKQGFGA